MNNEVRKLLRRIPNQPPGRPSTPSVPALRQVVPAPPMKPSRHKLFVIEDSNILSMTHDPRFRTLVPCLDQVQTEMVARLRKCGRCAQKQAEIHKDSMNRARHCLANLPPNVQVELKRLLNAEKVRVMKTSVKGQVVFINF